MEALTDTAKVFWSGFRGEEVRIRRHGNAVILEPRADDWAWLDAIVGKLDEDVAQVKIIPPVLNTSWARS